MIGFDAGMSFGAALSGISIQRGAEVTIDEVNANGGVLGWPLRRLEFLFGMITQALYWLIMGCDKL
jgi:hypothetical protein